MKYKRIDIEDMVDTKKIKDNNSPSGYSLGTYNGKVAINGFYLCAKRGSLLERVEQMAKTKFQLEFDPENYAQEARMEFWLSVNKYYDRFGFDENIKGDGFVMTDVKYKMMDKAKLAKSNVSVCDRATGKYHINKIESYERKFIEEKDKLQNQKDERRLHELYGTFTEENETTNEFRKWLDLNKEFILTKKQIDYLNGDVIIKDTGGEWRIKKNIVKRIDEAYDNERLKIEKEKKILKLLKTVTYLLDFKDEQDFIDRIIKTGTKKNDSIIIDLYENLTMDSCHVLTNILNSNSKEAKGIEYEINKVFLYDIISVLTFKEITLNEQLIKNQESEMIKWD